MRNRIICALAVSAMLTGGLVAAQSKKARLNPVIDLLSQGRPVFGLYAPSNRRPGGRGGPGAPGAPGGAPATPAPPPAPDKPASELAKEAVAYKNSDFVFDGSMEGGLDRSLPAFTAFVAGMKDAGALMKSPLRFTHPLIVKTPETATPTLHDRHRPGS